MKNAVLSLIAVAAIAVSTLHAVEKTAPNQRFYGKITSIDHNQKNVTVHNSKQDKDTRFQWNEQTTVISDRQPIAPTELKVGQSLMVSYITENDLNKAKRISVRRPFKKAQQ